MHVIVYNFYGTAFDGVGRVPPESWGYQSKQHHQQTFQYRATLMIVVANNSSNNIVIDPTSTCSRRD